MNGNKDRNMSLKVGSKAYIYPYLYTWSKTENKRCLERWLWHTSWHVDHYIIDKMITHTTDWTVQYKNVENITKLMYTYVDA
jgi:hypothetical protein